MRLDVVNHFFNVKSRASCFRVQITVLKCDCRLRLNKETAYRYGTKCSEEAKKSHKLICAACVNYRAWWRSNEFIPSTYLLFSFHNPLGLPSSFK